MKIGFIGLGKMGSNMVMNLLDHKHKVVVYNRSPEPVKRLEKSGAVGSYDLGEFFEKLKGRKIIWLMISAGKPVDEIINKLLPDLDKGDIIIDGGNSYYKDSQRRYSFLKKKGVYFLDCGVSGGIYGARHGAAMMIGGDKNAFRQVEKLFRDMCVKEGYAYMGKNGAGHFVKAVHNGIEYGMIGAIAEGMGAIKKNSKRFGTNLDNVVNVYSHGTIIESRLMSWLADGVKNKKYFESVSGKTLKGYTEDEMKKIKKMADMPILNQAILMRQKTRKKPSFAGKIISVIRNQFGGHPIYKKNK